VGNPSDPRVPPLCLRLDAHSNTEQIRNRRRVVVEYLNEATKHSEYDKGEGSSPSTQ